MSDNAIANYPKFSKLKLHHKDEMQSITAKFQPYSDFNFISLFSWNTDERTEISILNKNIVIKMPDYITEDPTYSLLGNNEVDASMSELLESTNKIKMVPEVVVNNVRNAGKFIIEEEDNNHDYIYRLETMYKLDGHRFKWKRKRLNRLKRDLGERLQLKTYAADLNTNVDNLLCIFDQWANDRNKPLNETKQERKAITNILRNVSKFKLLITEMEFDNEKIGFSINEVMHDGYANCHFQKVIFRVDNIDVLLTNKVAQDLIINGCEFVNWEQDLGIAGLRELKSSYCPEFLLKKFSISSSKQFF